LDLEEAAGRRLRGESREEIARALGVSASQIFRDLKKKEEEWLQSAREDFALLRVRELAKLRELEASYWRGWLTSKEPREMSWVRASEGPTPHTTTVTERTDTGEGDPAYLAGVLRCLRERSRILGLSGKTLERFANEREEHELLAEQLELVQTYNVASLLRRLEHTYGPIQVWLGLRCPETPGMWWGNGRLFGPEDWPQQPGTQPKPKGPRR
jgi:AcrR family transcriptional regulator